MGRRRASQHHHGIAEGGAVRPRSASKRVRWALILALLVVGAVLVARRRRGSAVEDVVDEPVVETPPAAPPWVSEPRAGYDIKVKLESGIYHRPGGFAYERTRADRWYASAEDAEADGFRAAKR